MCKTSLHRQFIPIKLYKLIYRERKQNLQMAADRVTGKLDRLPSIEKLP
jgi:hypothetical protein